jgi:hypothetical protein
MFSECDNLSRSKEIPCLYVTESFTTLFTSHTVKLIHIKFFTCRVQEFTAVTLKNGVFWGFVSTDISEEHLASIFKLERIGELRTSVC